jgi:ATP-dependent HslUV protease, peptidase subunit HslV
MQQQKKSLLLQQGGRFVSGIVQRLSAAATITVPHSTTINESSSSRNQTIRHTTVLCVRKGEDVVIMADGQVTSGSSILKPNVKKTRVLQNTDSIGASPHANIVIGGFAGATADAFTLFERLEQQLEQHPGQLMRAAVELATMWRMDKYLRRLDASLIVADKDSSLQITGNGDVVEPHDGILSIGSGSPYALAAARALCEACEDMDAESIARRSMKIASESCVYTNDRYSVLKIIDGSLAD